MYLLNAGPDSDLFWALLLDVLVLAAVIFALLLLRQSERKLLRFSASGFLLLLCLFALYQCEHSLSEFLRGALSAGLFLTLKLAAVVIILGSMLYRPRRALPTLRAFFLVLSPMFLVLTAQGLTAYRNSSTWSYQAHLAGMLPSTASGNRVIWIVFDELDYRMLFPARPARIQLPHFDALRKTSVFADHVKSPAPDTTAAIPSLLLGQKIPTDAGIRLGSRPVRVQFDGCTNFASLRSQQDVFRRARDAGYNTAVSGWFYAYCRLFGQSLSACATQEGAGWAVIPQKLFRNRPFLFKAAFLASWQARSLPLVGRWHWVDFMPNGGRYYREMHLMPVKFVLAHAFKMLHNPNLNFLLLHWPVPHPPGIWNTRNQTFSTSSQSNYFDNLELADRILGRIRAALEEDGTWDRTTILVSADHPFRPRSWLTGEMARNLSNDAHSEMMRLTNLKRQPYIPFFLKLPGQKTEVDYHREFNSVLSADLLLAALQGQIRTPAQSVQWLDAHAAASKRNGCPDA